MMRTRTGDYPIYFRRGWSDWQTGDLAAVATWAREAGFDGLDLHAWKTPDGDTLARDVTTLAAAGLQLGTVDLLQFDRIATPDAARRAAVRDANEQFIRAAAAAGATKFFTIVGGEPDRSRLENYRSAVEAFAPLADAAVNAGARIAVEGYPGGAPHYALLATTPETVRALLGDVPRGIGINYDPSHLIRLGVDPVRFLREFLPHVVHVHAKDTQWDAEATYEFGIYQPGAFSPARRFGQHAWRYTIPGNGQTPWAEILRVLHDGGYRGAVSVELEDEQFNGTETGEKDGLMKSIQFLSTV